MWYRGSFWAKERTVPRVPRGMAGPCPWTSASHTPSPLTWVSPWPISSLVIVPLIGSRGSSSILQGASRLLSSFLGGVFSASTLPSKLGEVGTVGGCYSLWLRGLWWRGRDWLGSCWWAIRREVPVQEADVGDGSAAWQGQAALGTSCQSVDAVTLSAAALLRYCLGSLLLSTCAQGCRMWMTTLTVLFG